MQGIFKGELCIYLENGCHICLSTLVDRWVHIVVRLSRIKDIRIKGKVVKFIVLDCLQ